MKLIILAIILNGMIALTGLLSYHIDGMFSVAQVRRFGRPRNLPLIAYGGVWGDLLLVNPVLVAVFGECGGSWTIKQWAVALAISFAASLAAHSIYKKNPDPDCIAWRGRLTKAGRVHVVYMAFAFAEMGLFYFATPHPSPSLLAAVSIILCLHACVGTQMVLNAFSPSWWNKTILEDIPGLVVILMVWSFIAWRYHAIAYAPAS